MKIKIALLMWSLGCVGLFSANAQSRYTPKTSVQISIGINQPPAYYPVRQVRAYPVRYVTRPYYSRHHKSRYYRSHATYRMKHIPPGHLKKIYGRKSAKAFAPGHQKYRKHRR